MDHNVKQSQNHNFLLLVLISCLLGGCALPGTRVPMPKHQNLEQSQINREWKLAPLGFEAAILNIKRGSIIGSFPGGYTEKSGSFCNYPRGREITSTEGRRVIDGRDGELAAIFYQTLTESGYNVVGDPKIVFGRKEELNKAKYLAAARIVDLKANICNAASLWDGRSLGVQSGEVFMEIEWSVYSNIQRAVVLNVKTTGYHKFPDDRPDGFFLIFADAFANATQNFGANPKLVALVNESQDKTMAVNAFKGTIRLRKVEPQKIFNTDYNPLLDSVVSVRAGGALGSGFVISPDGYILTNAHVVAGNDEVYVVFKAGFELVGKVVRSDKIKDVALVKVELNKAKPLSLKLDKPNVGDEVLAIGTPKDLAFEKTVTRGIVSSFRFVKDLQMDMIQSDVTIQPGNSGGPLIDKNGHVLGISTLGTPDAIGLNFFIPISTALETLNITVDGP
jgi:serine protease Do